MTEYSADEMMAVEAARRLRDGSVCFVRWDAVSRDRDRFRDWIQRHVLDTADVGAYHASLAEEATAA